MKTQRELAEFLYHMLFPRRDYGKLPDHVQRSYERDAARIIEFLTPCE